MKFRPKLTNVVEADRFDGTMEEAARLGLCVDHNGRGVVFSIRWGMGQYQPVIAGDYIVRSLVPIAMSAESFEATYEKVEP